jgi:3-dehydroquinate synthase
MGMMCAARLAQSLGRVDQSFVARQENLLRILRLPVEAPQVDPQSVLEAMGRDKKTEHGRLRFVLPAHLGRVELVGDITPSQVVSAISS